MSGDRSSLPLTTRLPAAPTALPRLRSVRESPFVGRNQCRTTPMAGCLLAVAGSPISMRSELPLRPIPNADPPIGYSCHFDRENTNWAGGIGRAASPLSLLSRSTWTTLEDQVTVDG